MKREVLQIHVIPAKFVKKREDGKLIIRCLLGLGGNTIQQRVFEGNMCEGMINPNYLLIGIKTGTGYIETKFIQAEDFADVFKDKWKALDETE